MDAPENAYHILRCLHKKGAIWCTIYSNGAKEMVHLAYYFRPCLPLRKWNGSVWKGSIWNRTVPYFRCKREKVPHGFRSNRNRVGRSTQSQKSSFLWHLGREIIKQTKESSLIIYPFSFGTVPFGSARLH